MYRTVVCSFLFCALIFPVAASAQFGKKKPKDTPPASAPVATAPVAPKATGPLKVLVAAVTQMEDGSAVAGDFRFVPGETAFFSLSLDNYKVGPGGRVELDSELEALDAKGVPIGPSIKDQIKTTLQDEDKDWKPKVRAQFQVPTIARPGTYSVRYKVTDLLASQTVSGEAKFPVVGPNVEASDTLVIRDFGFYRSEEEQTPLAVAAYTPGDTVWARFNITGYKYGPENAIDVVYDVAVLNGDGKEIFAQKDAAVERSKADYPQPWVPGGINLRLQKNMRPGAYALAITARDAMGKQSITQKYDFRLE